MNIPFLNPILLSVLALFILQMLLWSRSGKTLNRLKQRLNGVEARLRETRRLYSLQGQRLRSVALRLDSMADQAEDLRPVQVSEHDQQLRLAIRMAQRGAGIEDLVSVCGITRPEAEIVARMHRNESTPRVRQIHPPVDAAS